jgi:hypothetical protein
MEVRTISPKEVREAFCYEPATGILQRSSGKGKGRTIGYVTRKGYVSLSIKGVTYLAHRIAWIHFYGRNPEGQIDHLNGDRSDNRISNLRDVDGFVNGQNRHGANKNNPLGALGVYRTRSGTFGAKIIANGRRSHLGHFVDVESAQAAYLAAKKLLHVVRGA